jgi:hypothetical protein
LPSTLARWRRVARRGSHRSPDRANPIAILCWRVSRSCAFQPLRVTDWGGRARVSAKSFWIGPPSDMVLFAAGDSQAARVAGSEAQL